MAWSSLICPAAIDAAYCHAIEAVRLWVEDAFEDGEKLPRPRSLMELAADREVRRALAAPDLPKRTKQTGGRRAEGKSSISGRNACEGAQPASPDVFDRRGHGGERHLHLSTEQVIQCKGNAAIGLERSGKTTAATMA
jgi:hypothetical protein